MKHLYIDIETIPCQDESVREAIAQEISPPGNMSKAETIANWEQTKKPGLIEEAWKKTSFDGALGHVVCIGFAIDGAEPTVLHSGDGWGQLKGEAQLLRTFYNVLGKTVPEVYWLSLCWVGHNIVDFDFRFLYHRSVIHGIRPPHWIPFHSKPWGERVFDTMVAWCGGVRDRVSQDKLCRVLGIASKGAELGDEIDGSKVWDFVKAGRIEEVATYCGGDVERAREVHRRLTFAEV